MVSFAGLGFIFRFLPVFIILYSIVPSAYRDALLFAGSLVFYALGTGAFVLVLLGLVVVNFIFGAYTWVKPGQKDKSREKRLLIAIAAIDAAVLILFKMLALKVDSALLPLGLSFYLFKMISYQADLYLGRILKQPSFWQAAAYFTMFPQITQGPIMRFSDGWTTVASGPRKRLIYPARFITLRRIEDGLTFFAIGLGMKILIADRLGILWNEIEKIGFESISTPLAWLGAFGYSLQLYFDFWGYSLMASGIGVMLGFMYIENFLHPYAACGIADFYRRWHATLGSWFRDYVYIPLGGSRGGAAATVRNLLVVWLLTGFWHGGTLNYILWGLVLGCLIIWEKYVAAGLIGRFPLIGHIHVIVLIPLTWVIFAINRLKDLGAYYSRLFPFFCPGIAVNSRDFAKYLSIYWPFFAAGILLCIPPFYKILVQKRKNPAVIAALAIVFWVSIYFSAVSSANPFMYFSF